jgi:hypothetical protein
MIKQNRRTRLTIQTVAAPHKGVGQPISDLPIEIVTLLNIFE